ncbi:hypothetical protein EX895_002442 [Sporisorium graminicola]|uniref:Uncharacterized protein n=1 Tax=Sporisorium graminicola TaxID=280036 RepID=A0A4U7KUY2_9BASI|nr:hypothetical protein EX895_002442 [Sporisorium graminicola]TKY88454.1 hypothetical protein EX895_002442 [Sporisorium graminicola]
MDRSPAPVISANVPPQRAAELATLAPFSRVRRSERSTLQLSVRPSTASAALANRSHLPEAKVEANNLGDRNDAVELRDRIVNLRVTRTSAVAVDQFADEEDQEEAWSTQSLCSDSSTASNDSSVTLIARVVNAEHCNSVLAVPSVQPDNSARPGVCLQLRLGEKVYRCPVPQCIAIHVVYDSREDLKRHIRKRHNLQKPRG